MLETRFLQNLHSIFNKKDQLLLDLLEGSATVLEDWITKKDETALLRSIKNATGTFLDQIGEEFDEARLYLEEDTDYRTRLLDCLNGRGVTRPAIKKAVDYILSPQACSIIKWDDNIAGGQLERYEFEVQLPVRSMGGFILNQSYLGQDTYLRAWRVTKLLWDVTKIRATVEKLKSNASTFRLTGGGEVYG